MIGRLTGSVTLEENGTVIIDAGGVGYLVRVPASTLQKLKNGERAVLRVHTIFSQEQLSLFGFATSEEMRMFLLLLKVNRVGPSLALSVLGTLGAGGLARSIVMNDVQTLTSVPGVGKKTAERLLLELREKLSSDEDLTASSTPVNFTAGPTDARMDAIEALAALGYNKAQASGVVEPIWRQCNQQTMNVQKLITEALAQLSRPL